MWKTTPSICIQCMRAAVAARDNLVIRRILPEIPYVARKVSSLLLFPGMEVNDQEIIVNDKVNVGKWWLWCILFSPGSPFKMFVYYSNGMAGNISATEDILDRIVSFV